MIGPPVMDESLFFYIHGMNRKINLFVMLLLLFMFAACSDEAAEAEINRLTQENTLLQGKVDSLQKNLDSLTAYGDSVKKSLEKLDMHP